MSLYIINLCLGLVRETVRVAWRDHRLYNDKRNSLSIKEYPLIYGILKGISTICAPWMRPCDGWRLRNSRLEDRAYHRGASSKSFLSTESNGRCSEMTQDAVGPGRPWYVGDVKTVGVFWYFEWKLAPNRYVRGGECFAITTTAWKRQGYSSVDSGGIV